MKTVKDIWPKVKSRIPEVKGGVIVARFGKAGSREVSIAKFQKHLQKINLYGEWFICNDGDVVSVAIRHKRGVPAEVLCRFRRIKKGSK